MKLDIVIPTRNRIKKLETCISSVKEAILEINKLLPFKNIKRSHTVFYSKIIVYVDSEKEKKELEIKINNIYHTEPVSILGIKDSYIEIRILKEEYKAAKFWNTYLKNMEADVLCYLNDDIKLDKYCLRNGLEELASLDYDGVVGFYQSNQIGTTNCNAAFGLIGSKFADRFPDRKVFNEDYYCLYLDEELMKYAQSINKFIGSKTATLKHYHPVFTKEQPDETHKWNRRYKQRDISVYKIRKERNLIWGNNFERITPD